MEKIGERRGWGKKPKAEKSKGKSLKIKPIKGVPVARFSAKFVFGALCGEKQLLRGRLHQLDYILLPSKILCRIFG